MLKPLFEGQSALNQILSARCPGYVSLVSTRTGLQRTTPQRESSLRFPWSETRDQPCADIPRDPGLREIFITTKDSDNGLQQFCEILRDLRQTRKTNDEASSENAQKRQIVLHLPTFLAAFEQIQILVHMITQ